MSKQDFDIETELLIELEPEKEDRMSKLRREYELLNEKCDTVLSLIKQRKQRKAKTH